MKTRAWLAACAGLFLLLTAFAADEPKRTYQTRSTVSPIRAAAGGSPGVCGAGAEFGAL